MTKRIGILTSGGDCAGLNATIRAATLRAAQEGWTMVGIRNGTAGLMATPPLAEVLEPSRCDAQMLRLGGTILGTTNKGNPFKFPMPDGRVKDRANEVVAGYHALDLDALIGIGGDGSLAILRAIAARGGLNLVGIPKTIDNDVAMTEVAIGHSTAVLAATQALDNLQPTAASHERVMVLEVMGRDAGHIAIAAGIAGGADVVLIPEIPWHLDSVVAQLGRIKADGRNFALVIVAEAVPDEAGRKVASRDAEGKRRYGGVGHEVAARLAKATGAETRVTVLGHVQRGGAPDPRDRLMGAAFGVHAVELIRDGKFDRMVAWWNRRVVDVPLEKVVARSRTVDPVGPLVTTARGLGICLGD
ncbi:MAG: ATP-dependent 6-phosphofructokinase [Alphaproteobacteria bacterium]|nr:ATP-dependent 6-phosphofructokinase [Alphaproteobacteria bacterium]